MARKFKLRPSHLRMMHSREERLDRQKGVHEAVFQYISGLITTASLGSVGFASFLMGQAEGVLRTLP